MSRAEHDMKGKVIIVSSRLFRFSMVRVAMMAGTLQPKPVSIGKNDLPCSPTRRSKGSKSSAVRAR